MTPADQLRVDARHIRAEIAGVEYEWSGGFGAILISRERGVKRSDMRMIGNAPFYAYCIFHRNWWETPEVWWTVPHPHLNAEWIRTFKLAVFAS